MVRTITPIDGNLITSEWFGEFIGTRGSVIVSWSRRRSMDDRKRFGARVRDLRKQAGFTQQELGERAGVSYKFLGGVERGEENPSLLVIGRIAAGLGLGSRDLFDFEHEDTPARLRSGAKKIVDEASPEELRRIFRVVRALTT